MSINYNTAFLIGIIITILTFLGLFWILAEFIYWDKKNNKSVTQQTTITNVQNNSHFSAVYTITIKLIGYCMLGICIFFVVLFGVAGLLDA